MIGIDDSAKSNWLGDIFIAGVQVRNERQIPEGVKDCKKLSCKKIQEIYREVKKRKLKYSVVRIPPNKFEKQSMAISIREAIEKIIKDLNPKPKEKIHIDFMGTNFKAPNGVIIHEPKADEKYKVCSLASVIAKAERDIYFRNLGLDFSDYDYKMLDKIPVEELLKLPIRKRWVASYFKNKGEKEKAERILNG